MHNGGVRGGGGHFMSPSKDHEKKNHKNAIKHENRDTPPDFLTIPSTPSKEFETDCASMI
jgi:hypothetical protein